MIRIVFLIRSLGLGGAERQLVTLAQYLDKNQFDIKVLCFYPGGLLEKELSESGVEVISLDKKGRWEVLRFLWRLGIQLRRLHPDILYAYMDSSNLLSVLLRPMLWKTRIVWGIRASNMDWSYYDWLARFIFRLECYLSRFADLIIINSNDGRSYHVAHGFPEEKIVVIPNGIDTERYHPDPVARERVRKEWGILDDEKLIGLVGRLDPIKDHPTFLKAAALLAQERKDVRFVCVGDGPIEYRNQLFMQSQKLRLQDRLVWAGERTDMSSIYNAIDIASSSSVSEGFPNVIGEAMACGVPFVVTDVGDSASIVGDKGVIVPPKNPLALKNAFVRLLSMMKNGKHEQSQTRERIISRFSLSDMVVNMEREFFRLFSN